MNLIKRINHTFFIIFFLVSCNSETNKTFDHSYYNSEEEWLPLMEEIGFEKGILRDQVLLVLHSTECMPCMKELEWWNQSWENNSNANVALVVIERHEAVFDAYLNTENIQIPAYQDSSASTLKDDLIPTTPVKVFFNNKGKITVMDYMGTNGDLQKFLNEAGVKSTSNT